MMVEPVEREEAEGKEKPKEKFVRGGRLSKERRQQPKIKQKGGAAAGCQKKRLIF